jgi:hypothetical protein
LRLDIVQDNAVFVLMLDSSGDFTIDDFLKDGFHEEGRVARVIGAKVDQGRRRRDPGLGL